MNDVAYENSHLRQMGREELGHSEGTNAVTSKDLSHLLVGHKELLVLRVLKVVFLDVGPQLLDAFGPAGFLLADDVSELRAELHGLGKSCSLRHFDRVWVAGSGLRKSTEKETLC